MKSIFFGYFLLFGGIVHSQVNMVAHYAMDDCSLNDELRNFDGFIFGNLCSCGAFSNGLQLNGNEVGDFSEGLSSVFQSDYTLSFYASFDESVNRSMDIFSLTASCNSDTALLIRYVPDFNLFRVRFSDSPDNRIELSAIIENPSCMNYIALAIESGTGRLYINNVLSDEQSAISAFSFSPVAGVNFTLSDSPCNDIPIGGDVRFSGRIDELKIYDGALSLRDIRSQDLKPNQIILGDTTIFEGESVVLRTGQFCTDMFSWSPDTGLTDPTASQPIAIPPLGTTTYMLSINDGSCVATDEVSVNVVNREQLTCADLILPNTFTPNGDGVNDFFGLSNSFLVDELISFEIFDKWGGRIFQTNTIDAGWNGRRLDNQVDVGNSSYVYKVSYNCGGEKYVVTGVVNVLR